MNYKNLPQNRSGDDINVNIQLDDVSGNAINIDNLTELYIYIIDPADVVVKRFSKAGAPIGGNEFTALTREDAENYSFWIDSAITKAIEQGLMEIEINVVENEPELTDGFHNSIGRANLTNLKPSIIKELS